MESKVKYIFVLVFGFLLGVIVTLFYNRVSSGDSQNEVKACCPLEGNDYHRSPHPKKAYAGTMSSLSSRGLKFFHYKVETTGKETRCGGHDEGLDKGLPCNNLGPK